MISGRFNWVDLAILMLVALYLWRGWRDGFIRAGLNLIGLALLFWAGLRYYDDLSAWLEHLGVPEAYGKAIGFLLAGIIAASLFWLLFGLVLSQLPAGVHRSCVNRLLGLGPGVVSGLIVAALLVTLATVAPLDERATEAIRASPLAGWLIARTTDVEGQLRPIFGDAVAETLQFLTVHPESDAFLKLPYRVADPTPVPVAEDEMLRLVNEARVQNGLRPLVVDDSLRMLARAHSRDMFQRGYFSHYTPEGRSPFDRMEAAHIRFLAAGENLALAPSVQTAFRGLMNSPGHRANILSPSFQRVGIGALDGGLHGIMFSQEFTN